MRSAFSGFKPKTILIVFLYWLVLGYLVESFTHFFSGYRFLNVIENTISIFLILLIISGINRYSTRKKVLYFIIPLIVIMIWFETIMYYLFKISFGPSSYFVMLNTNPDEASEFLKEYVSLQVFFITFLFFLPLLKIKDIASKTACFSFMEKFKNYWCCHFGFGWS